MKFNAIVGNPPYQVMDGGAQASSVPVYQYFVSIAKKVQPNFISMIMYNRGIQMYRFPNSDVQKSVIFEGIKKRLKIV